MSKTFPKYLRELDTGIVLELEQVFGPDEINRANDSLYHVTADLGNMKAKIYTNQKFDVGSSICLRAYPAYNIQMDDQLYFRGLQSLLERFGCFRLLSEEEKTETEGEIRPIKNWAYQINSSPPVPAVVAAYVDEIINVMTYTADVSQEAEKIVIAKYSNIDPSSPKNLYDLGVLHAQLVIELEKGEAIKSGSKSVANQKQGRVRSKKTKAKRKCDVDQNIRNLVESNSTLKNLVGHNYSQATAMIFKLKTTEYLPSERQVKEKYLPRLYPRKSIIPIT